MAAVRNGVWLASIEFMVAIKKSDPTTSTATITNGFCDSRKSCALAPSTSSVSKMPRISVSGSMIVVKL